MKQQGRGGRFKCCYRLTEKFYPLGSPPPNSPAKTLPPLFCGRQCIICIMHACNSIRSRHQHNNNKVTFTFCQMDEIKEKEVGIKVAGRVLRERGKNCRRTLDLLLFSTKITNIFQPFPWQCLLITKSLGEHETRSTKLTIIRIVSYKYLSKIIIRVQSFQTNILSA